MKFPGRFDVVLEMDFPLKESSELAYDTWGRAIRKRVDPFGCRVVRSKNHLKISLSRDMASPKALGVLVELLTHRVASQIDADLVIRVHQVPDLERVPADRQLAIKEVM